VKAPELAERIKSRTAPTVIDARSGLEFEHGHIPGAIHAPVLEILLNRARLPDKNDSELVITCEHGPRALMAKCLLDTYGYGNTTLLEGHMLGWRNAGLPLEEKGQHLDEVSYDALDFKVLLSDGSTKPLSSFWDKRPVALVFPRHFGCPFGRRQVVQLCREQKGLKKAGVDVVLFSSGTAAQAEVFRHDYEVPFPIVVDSDRVLFKKFGLREMDSSDYISPYMLLQVVEVLVEGYGYNPFQGSSSQLGGVFIVDTGGKVRFAHVSANAADHPSPLEIIQAAATLKPRRARTQLAKSRPTPRTAAVSKRQRRPGGAEGRPTTW
jgi:hydroxyacylglutathione hydrolase